MGDEVQAIKAGLLEVADLVVVNKGDRPGAQRTASQLRAMLSAAAPRPEAGDDRPRPKRPDVLVTTASTGDGVPELLAAIDRHRAAATAQNGDSSARLDRARAQVWAIVGDRIQGRLSAGNFRSETEGILAAVAGHELDPFSAADRLLAILTPTDRRG